jgi:hypothetical protein
VDFSTLNEVPWNRSLTAFGSIQPVRDQFLRFENQLLRTKGRELQEVSKEVAGTRALLTLLAFGGYILRRLRLRGSPVKSTSAALQL